MQQLREGFTRHLWLTALAVLAAVAACLVLVNAALAEASTTYAVYYDSTLTFYSGVTATTAEAEEDDEDAEATVTLTDDDGSTISYEAYWADSSSSFTTSTFTGASSAPWYEYRTKITSVVVDSSMSDVALTSTSYWFFGMTSLTSVSGLSNLCTSSVTNMSSMFQGCTSLETLDLSGLDTSSATSMYTMLDNCSALTSLTFGGSFTTKNVTTMYGMFQGCSSLASLGLSSFDTSSLTNMQCLFYGCKSLTSLDLSSFDTSSVTNMCSVFAGCTSLTSLDLTSFDTSAATTMEQMFWGCSSLTSLGLATFDTSSVTNMHNMFLYCTALETIYASSSLWSTQAVTNGAYMFEGCTKLTGGAGTTYSSENEGYNGVAYALIDVAASDDGSTSATAGYLTDAGSIEFLGGALRMIFASEATGESTGTEYVTDSTDLRFGFTWDGLPDGASVSWGWYWGLSKDAVAAKSNKVVGVNFRTAGSYDSDPEDASGTLSNLVITGIGTGNFATSIYAQLYVSYTVTDDYGHTAYVLLASDVETKSVDEVAKAIVSSGTAAEKTYVAALGYTTSSTTSSDSE